MGAREHLVTLGVLAAMALLCYHQRSQIYLTLQYESSPVNWCEENYVYNNWIVEFWNSLSSFLLSGFGLWGIIAYRNDAKFYRFEPTMFLVWVVMIVVGLGSVWFHATLSVAGQISDEVPIVVLCLVIITMSRSKQQLPMRAQLLSGHLIARASMVLFTFCLFFPVLSHVICIVFLPIGLYVFTKDYRDLNSDQPLFKRLFWATNVTFYIALGVWVLDRTACDEITQWGKTYLGFYPQLHAIWHVFIGLTFWLVVCLFVLMKAFRERGIKPTLKPRWYLAAEVDYNDKLPSPTASRSRNDNDEEDMA